jgi:hypothetical protein
MNRLVIGQRAFLLFLTAYGVSSWAAEASWQPDAMIAIPSRNTAVMAMGKGGSLIVTSINNTASPGPASAYRVTNPHSLTPIVTPFATRTFPPFRGYSGVACDAEGFIYLAADGGTSFSSILVKYTPWLLQVPQFGANGQVGSETDRFQGLAVDGEQLVALANWSRLSFFSLEGISVGSSRQLSDPVSGPTLRDIALVPSSHDILAINGGQLYRFTGGAPEAPEDYRLELIRDGAQQKTIGQGICYHPATGQVYFPGLKMKGLHSASIAPGVMNVVNESSTVIGPQLSAVSDAAVSDDGQFLYVSDLRTSGVVRFRNTAAVTENPIQIAQAPTVESQPVAVHASTTAATAPQATAVGNSLTIPPAPGGDLAPIGGTAIFMGDE